MKIKINNGEYYVTEKKSRKISVDVGFIDCLKGKKEVTLNIMPDDKIKGSEVTTNEILAYTAGRTQFDVNQLNKLMSGYKTTDAMIVAYCKSVWNIKIHKTTLENIRRGRTKPSIGLIICLCKYYVIDFDFFMRKSAK